MERMEPSVPIIYRQLYVRHVGIGESVGLCTVDGREEGVVAHRERGEY